MYDIAGGVGYEQIGVASCIVLGVAFGRWGVRMYEGIWNGTVSYPQERI